MIQQTEKKLPQTYEQYLKEVGDNLTRLETAMDKVSGLDERVDITNHLLIEISKLLSNMLILLNTVHTHTKELVKPNPFTTITQQKVVPTAGTAIQLPYVEIPRGCEIVIKALATNTGVIYVGNSKANAEDHTMSFPLTAGESIEYKIQNLNEKWIDSAVDGEGVVWSVEQE